MKEFVRNFMNYLLGETKNVEADDNIFEVEKIGRWQFQELKKKGLSISVFTL